MSDSQSSGPAVPGKRNANVPHDNGWLTLFSGLLATAAPDQARVESEWVVGVFRERCRNHAEVFRVSGSCWHKSSSLAVYQPLQWV